MAPNADFEVFGCFRLFLTLFWVIFWPMSAALDPLWACGWWISSLRIITGYTPAYFGKKNYFQTQKTEFGHLLLKIHFWVGYPPLGDDFVEKWVVDKKNWNRQRLGIEKTFQKLYGNPYYEYLNFYNDGWNQMLILRFLAVLGCFWPYFGSYFHPLAMS